uniref:Uncharacterized protein n=1 Tax=Arundo donax TaxID=35708 RepID=A0A0A9A8S2_ARUDO
MYSPLFKGTFTLFVIFHINEIICALICFPNIPIFMNNVWIFLFPPALCDSFSFYDFFRIRINKKGYVENYS